MSAQSHLDPVLANYFAVDLALLEAEGAAFLKRDLSSSPELRSGLKVELRKALSDFSYSWQGALERHDVVQMENEAQARSYAAKLLGWATIDLL